MARYMGVERRRGIGPGLWHAARALGLALAGFAYLFLLIVLLSVAAERMGVL